MGTNGSVDAGADTHRTLRRANAHGAYDDTHSVRSGVSARHTGSDTAHGPADAGAGALDKLANTRGTADDGTAATHNHRAVFDPRTDPGLHTCLYTCLCTCLSTCPSMLLYACLYTCLHTVRGELRAHPALGAYRRGHSGLSGWVSSEVSTLGLAREHLVLGTLCARRVTPVHVYAYAL